MTWTTAVEGLPPASRWLGHLPQLLNNTLETITEASKSGDVAMLRLGPLKGFIFSRPEDIEYILVKNSDNYDKKLKTYVELQALLGTGLLTSYGAFWQRQRRIAQPAFNHGRIVGFTEVINQASQRRIAAWERLGQGGGELDVHAEMMP